MANKGSRYERELVGVLNDEGFLSFRMGGSGSGTADDRVDVVAGRPWTGESLSIVKAIEAKFIGSGREAVDLNIESDLEQPQSFVGDFGGEAYVGLRWSGDTTWYFKRATEIEHADGAVTTRVRKDQMGDWQTIEQINTL